MSDEFHIQTVENLITELPLAELSDISKIIREMITIKNDITRNREKRTKAYDINDKISLNQFSDTLKAKIEKNHIEHYDLVDDAINCIEEYEAAIRSDLYDYYWEAYTDVLIDLEIDLYNDQSIKDNSDKIYTSLLKKIDSQLFAGKVSNIEINKKITYLCAITAYVFYECKFLIPIEGH